MSQAVITSFGTAPIQLEKGYSSLGVIVDGTDDQILHAFRHQDAKLVRGASIYKTDEHEFYPMVKSTNMAIHEKDGYIGLGIEIAGTLKQVESMFRNTDTRFVLGDKIPKSEEFFYYPMVNKDSLMS